MEQTIAIDGVQQLLVAARPYTTATARQAAPYRAVRGCEVGRTAAFPGDPKIRAAELVLPEPLDAGRTWRVGLETARATVTGNYDEGLGWDEVQPHAPHPAVGLDGRW